MSEPARRMLSRTDWAFVHQNPRDGLRMGVSAGGNVGERLMAVGARHYGNIRQSGLDWLGRVEIAGDRIDDRPTSFSGGMQQTLADRPQPSWTGPRLVFMDEPTGGPRCLASQARLLDLFARLGPKHGAERNHRHARPCRRAPPGGPPDGNERRVCGGNRLGPTKCWTIPQHPTRSSWSLRCLQV